MRSRFEGCAETLGGLYFRDLLRWVKDLQGARLAVVEAFVALQREYDEAFPRCRLLLYPRYRPLHGPTALYWGEVVPMPLTGARAASQGGRKVIWHKRGNFQPSWAFTVARHSDRVERFRDFDRRRLALNGAHKAVMGAFVKLRNATLRRFSTSSPPIFVASALDPDLRREVPEIPEGLLPGDLPSWVTLALQAGWVATFTLGLAEEEASVLAVEVMENPSAAGLCLELSDRRKLSWVRDLRWRHDPTRTSHRKLTDCLMRKLHVREGVRPVMALKERKRRRLEKGLHRTASAFDAFRKSCESAQAAVALGLAEAKVILLPESGRLGTAPTTVAG